jgi:L-lactate dehydrogenase complex protein LldG
MSTGISSREEILRRVRSATGGVSTGEAAREGWNAMSRSYKREGRRSQEVLLGFLEDRLRDYDATVCRAERIDVAKSVAGMLSRRGKRRIVVPSGLPAEWLPAGFEFIVDDGLAAAMLDAFDGVMTGSAVIISAWFGSRMSWRLYRRRWSVYEKLRNLPPHLFQDRRLQQISR